MKRFLVLFVSLFLFSLPSFGDNSLQREYEINMITSNPVFSSMDTTLMLKDDYSHYLKGGGSLYGVLKYQEEVLKKNLNNINKTNLLYTQKMLKDYDCFYRFGEKEYCAIKTYIVENETYKILNSPIKQVMCGLNYIFNH